MSDQAPQNLICRLTFDPQELVAFHPPQFHHPNKVILNQLANPPGSSHRGRLVFSRWRALPLPSTFQPADIETVLEAREGFYGYESLGEDKSACEWYVNFAHHDLFCSYGLGVFAQDEIQVGEHPALASLREALLNSNAKPLTVENGIPTPALIMGVQRRCSISTDRNAEAGRPFGLYGRQFALASPEAIERATALVEPPTVTNLIAMEAPSYGKGAYTREQLEYILVTAFTGFSAACHESMSESSSQPEVIVHTGYWGCGAYGGNRIVMALLQIVAANLSRVNRLVFHLPDRSGVEALETARQLYMQDLTRAGGKKPGFLQALKSLLSRSGSDSTTQAPFAMSELVRKIQEKRFQWGASDGN